MISALLLPIAVLAAPLRDESFQLAQPCEVVAVLTAGCERCAWGRKGREAAALSLAVDGRYSQHPLLARGEAAAEYRVALGSLAPGGASAHPGRRSQGERGWRPPRQHRQGRVPDDSRRDW